MEDCMIETNSILELLKIALEYVLLLPQVEGGNP
jgi:hypothetical protein